MPHRTANIRIGCAGFAGSQESYYRQYQAVEIGTSFYNLPQSRTVERWREQAPDGFIFAMKAWQVITHRASSATYRRTRLESADREHAGHFGFNPTVRWAWERTVEVASTLGARVVLFQSPPGFRPTRENLGRLRMFFERCRRGKLELAWEPQGTAWDPGQVAALADELGLLTVMDPLSPSLVLPARRHRTWYCRRRGDGQEMHAHTDAQLDQLAAWLCRPGTRSRETICIFSNRGMAVDARRLQRRVGDGSQPSAKRQS